MSITEEVTFDKEGNMERATWRTLIFDKLFLSTIIILVAILSFGIGRLSVVGNREAIKIEYDSSITNTQSPTSKQISNSNNQTVGANTVMASKNGSKYHYSHCTGAKQIKEENKITFASASAAEAAGYTLASNCSPR